MGQWDGVRKWASLVRHGEKCSGEHSKVKGAWGSEGKRARQVLVANGFVRKMPLRRSSHDQVELAVWTETTGDLTAM